MSHRWPLNDVRGRIIQLCVNSPSVAEISARLDLPLGVTRVLVGDLVTVGLPSSEQDVDRTVDPR